MDQFLSIIFFDSRLGAGRRSLPAAGTVERRAPGPDPDGIRRPPLYLALALLRP